MITKHKLVHNIFSVILNISDGQNAITQNLITLLRKQIIKGKVESQIGRGRPTSVQNKKVRRYRIRRSKNKLSSGRIWFLSTAQL